jgi:hypothetical protein
VTVIRSPGGTKGVLVQPDALQPKPGYGQLRFQVAQKDAVNPEGLSGSHSVDLWTKAHYKGEFLNGKFHGHGLYQFSDGRSYEGQFQNGNISGRGKFFWPMKSQSRPISPASSVSSPQALAPDHVVEYVVFEGVFLDNKPVEGTLTLPDDTGFEGPVKEVLGERQGLVHPPNYSPRKAFTPEGAPGPDKSRAYTQRPSVLELFTTSFTSQPTENGAAKPRPSLRI